MISWYVSCSCCLAFLNSSLKPSVISVIIGIPNGLEAPPPKKNEISFVETGIVYKKKITTLKTLLGQTYDPVAITKNLE